MPDELVAVRIAEALQKGEYDPQHAGELFLRADAERAIKGALGGAKVAVAGRGAGDVRPVGFMGARYQPDLVVDAGGTRVALTITLLRGEAAALGHTLAGALVLSNRYHAV